MCMYMVGSFAIAPSPRQHGVIDIAITLVVVQWTFVYSPVTILL